MAVNFWYARLVSTYALFVAGLRCARFLATAAGV